MLTSRRRIARSPLESDSARKRAQSVWQQAGGYLVKSDGPRDFPTRTLAHRGVQVELSLRPNSSHRTARWQTCVRALYPYPVGPRFVVAAAHPDASLPETLFTSAAPGALVAGSPDGDVDDGERPFCAEISAVDDTLRLLSPVFGALRDLWPRALRIEGDRQGVQIGVAGYLDNAEALSPENPILCYLDLANRLCKKMGIGFIDDPDLDLMNCPANQLLGFGSETFEHVAELLQETLESEMEIFV